MIKKYLLWLWIAFLGFLWFSSATFQTFLIWTDKYASNWNNQYDIWFLNKWRFLTNYLWIWKALVWLDNQYLIFWNDWLYLYTRKYSSSHWTLQWYFQYYKSCDEITIDMTWDSLQNCSSVQQFVYNNDEIVNNFMSSLVVWDFVFIDEWNSRNWCWWYCTYNRYTINFCFSSSVIWKTMCFVWDKSDYESSSYWSRTPFTWSLWFWSWVNFSNINSSYLQNPPWFMYEWSTDWSTEWNINNQLTWDYVYADCTWNDILIALESEGYNKYVCYWWLDNFDLYESSINYNPIAWTWLSISQIWAWNWSRAWDNFPEWFTFWNWLYKDSSENNYNAMWESYPAVYRTYFQLYNAYKWSVLDPRTVLEYCQLRTLTWDQLNNSAWGYFKPVCETIIREKQTWLWQSRLDWSIYSWGIYTWDVPIWTNWNWVWNMSWVTTQSDWLNFIQNFFNLAKSNLLTNYSWTPFGILPSYIVIFLIALILFRFISH